jgi:prolyl 4-hydroxylase
MTGYKQEANGIFAFSVFSKRFCKAAIKRVANFGSWAEAEVREVSDDGDYFSRSRPDVRAASWWFDRDEDKLYGRFDEKINEVIKPLAKQIWSLSLTEHAGNQIVRYSPGGHYVAHTDTGLDLDHRCITVICYLNDEFDGGNTFFPRLNHRAKPETGKVLLFPSNYLHRAEPVLKGEKYVFISWLVTAPPVKWI